MNAIAAPAAACLRGRDTQVPHAELKRLARALSAVKRRVNHPKLPNDICYAGVALSVS